MKELEHLNKYLLKYKLHIILGILFTILTNFFQIVPAQMVRFALDLVVDNVSLYDQLEGFDLQEGVLKSFGGSILIYALLILALALTRGFFLFLVRQT